MYLYVYVDVYVWVSDCISCNIMALLLLFTIKTYSMFIILARNDQQKWAWVLMLTVGICQDVTFYVVLFLTH